jgi:hypothetical protein
MRNNILFKSRKLGWGRKQEHVRIMLTMKCTPKCGWETSQKDTNCGVQSEINSLFMDSNKNIYSRPLDIIIIIIIIIIITFMHGTYNYIPEINHVSRVNCKVLQLFCIYSLRYR